MAESNSSNNGSGFWKEVKKSAGKVVGIGLWCAIVGTVVGFVVAGPPGAAAGAKIGAGIGTAGGGAA